MVQATTVGVSRAERAQGIKRMALGLMVAVAGALAVTGWAHAHSQGPRGGDAAGMFMGGGHGHKGGHSINRLLKSVDATDAQRAQISQIMQAARADLKAQREASRSLREQGVQLFTAPVVDARAVEALRQQQLAQHDQASKRMTQAMLDVSAVLTPEQRVKLGERMKQRAQALQERIDKRMQERAQQGGAASSPAR